MVVRVAYGRRVINITRKATKNWQIVGLFFKLQIQFLRPLDYAYWINLVKILKFGPPASSSYSALFVISSVHILLHKSSLECDINDIIIQTGLMKQNMDRWNSKKCWIEKKLSNWDCQFFLKNQNFWLNFLSNLATSRANWHQIWTMCIKVNKIW